MCSIENAKWVFFTRQGSNQGPLGCEANVLPIEPLKAFELHYDFWLTKSSQTNVLMIGRFKTF